MSCSWLAPIHALRHRFLMLEFERGMYPLVVNEHANASGFGTMLGWSRRQYIESIHPGGLREFCSPF